MLGFNDSMREALEANYRPPIEAVGGGLQLNQVQERERGRTMKKWEVTFTGDDWKLTVCLDYQEGDLFGLIEKAKEVASSGECGIKVEGYYQVDEREVI